MDIDFLNTLQVCLQVALVALLLSAYMLAGFISLQVIEDQVIEKLGRRIFPDTDGWFSDLMVLAWPLVCLAWGYRLLNRQWDY